MCGGSPKIPDPAPPPPPPPPPAETAPQSVKIRNEGAKRSASSGTSGKRNSRRTGTNSLRIPLNVQGGGATGLNIPQG